MAANFNYYENTHSFISLNTFQHLEIMWDGLMSWYSVKPINMSKYFVNGRSYINLHYGKNHFKITFSKLKSKYIFG